MPSVAVVTDSTHYLPRDVVERHRLHDVSLYLNWNGKTRRESEITDYDAFYEELRTAAALPSTSQPSVGDFLAVYEPLLESGQDILSVHIAGGISGTVGAAEQARESLIEQGIDAGRIRVVDSRTGCAAFGLVAIAGSNAIRDGADLAGAAQAAERLRDAITIWFAVDTLEYLRRGGRIGAAGAWLGSALKIKPILTMEDEIKPLERVRTSKRAMDRLVDFWETKHAEGCDRFFIQHIQAQDVAERLAERGRAIFGRSPDILSEIGPVIGAHVGPGLIGVSALPSSILGPV
jgi:fatty acid kinase fatty acid binding subunit